MRSFLSTFALAAFCVGAIVLSACAAPFNTSHEGSVNLKTRGNIERDTVDNFWLVPLQLPASSLYSPDSANYGELLDSINGDTSSVISDLQDAFELLFGENPTEFYGTDQVSFVYEYDSGNGVAINIAIEGGNGLVYSSTALTGYFNAIWQSSPSDISAKSNAFATQVQNALADFNAIELCAPIFYDSYGPVIIGLVQMGWGNSAYQNYGNDVENKLYACSVYSNQVYK